ncbi:MAG TPA: hypothetical protein VHV54_22110 [Candidatus Binatia bacterium]|nr:hypothetical protein [Candidatus Binatia bacterium]
MRQSRRYLSRISLALAVLFLSASWNPVAFAQSSMAQSYKELFERSEKEKKGLTFYVKGQTISGVVVKVGGDAIEIRNQTFSRIIIRLDSIDAVAMN